MIQLHRDYLLFETAKGQIIPCSAELIAVELIGEAMEKLDPDLVHQAAAAVLHYFKEDLGWTTVSVGEFSQALADALEALGLQISSDETPGSGRVSRYDLRRLAGGSGRTLELCFFPRLREEFRTRLARSPDVLQFHGLRACVKQLTGAKRWTHRCEALSDQIVEYLRACLETESVSRSCRLMIN
jgi:hypothetical protein